MEFAYTKLRDKLCRGELPPGHQLVNRKLGQELGVSTVTLREAIRRLTNEGLVEHIPNAGAYVRELNRKDMIDLLRMRAKIDCLVVEEAVGKSPHQLRPLTAICRQWREMILTMRDLPDRRLSGDMFEHWLELDAQFHSVLVEAADNCWLTKVIADLDLNSRAIRTKALYLTFAEAAQTYRHHASITRALAKNDVQAALHWMKIHGEASLTSLMKQLDKIHASGTARRSIQADQV